MEKRAGRTYYCVGIALTYAEMGQRRRAMYWWQKPVVLGDGSAALSLAKFLIGTDKPKVSKRVIGLLKQAAASEEYVQITVDEKEEAEELLEKLKPPLKRLKLLINNLVL